MAKHKKPNRTGYSYSSLLVGIPNAEYFIRLLKKIADREMRSISAQARLFIVDGIKNYVKTHKMESK